VGLGVRKLRITGGEPLLRRDLPRLIEMLASLGVEIALTSNGVLLPRLSAALKGAGVTRVTVSLDALDEAVFQRVLMLRGTQSKMCSLGSTRPSAPGSLASK
jgi:cyclic pyranopterin phosphate synthase